MDEDNKREAFRWRAEYNRRRSGRDPQLTDEEFETLRACYNKYQRELTQRQRNDLRAYKERFGSL